MCKERPQAFNFRWPGLSIKPSKLSKPSLSKRLENNSNAVASTWWTCSRSMIRIRMASWPIPNLRIYCLNCLSRLRPPPSMTFWLVRCLMSVRDNLKSHSIFSSGILERDLNLKVSRIRLSICNLAARSRKILREAICLRLSTRFAEMLLERSKTYPCLKCLQLKMLVKKASSQMKIVFKQSLIREWPT